MISASDCDPVLITYLITYLPTYVQRRRHFSPPRREPAAGTLQLSSRFSNDARQELGGRGLFGLETTTQIHRWEQ